MPAKALVDSGPLVALFDRNDQYYKKALEFIQTFEGTLVSTVAVITEVVYLLDFSTAAQTNFIDWISNGARSSWSICTRTIWRAYLRSCANTLIAPWILPTPHWSP